MKVWTRALVALLAFCGGIAWGQATNSADVTGSVTDPSGAVVPGVTIVIKDIDKGTVRTLTSNGAGLYDSGPIVANDQYTITFSREGFQSLQRGPMVLQVLVLYLERPATQQCAVACSRAGRFGYSDLKEAALMEGYVL